MMEQWRTCLARLCGVACVSLGIIGLIVGFTDKVWRLGEQGYFTGGALLGIVALILLMDEHLQLRRRQ